MKKRLLSLLIVLLYLHITSASFAQTNTTLPFKIFFEKAYLQTDRTYYTSGEDIWYKAYLVNATSNYPTATSNNLYVELTAPGTIISRQVIYMDNGFGNGDLRLPDGLKAGTYKLRAYTNWMKNFGDNFIYEKEIHVTSASGTPVENKENDAINLTKTSVMQKYRLQFFPEGGSMIAGVVNTIAFKAEDVYGKGLLCEGVILNSKGKSVATFKSSYNGMGSFNYTPESNEFYTVKATCNGKPFNTELPFALEKGFGLSLAQTDTAFYTATIKTNQPTLAALPGQRFYITARHAGKVYYEDSVQLSSTSTTIKIPTRQLPAGIAVVTLYDEKLRPNSERLIFINKVPAAQLAVTLAKNSYADYETPVVNISVNNQNGGPVKANLAMAVVDAAVVPASTENITNYLLLQSELKGSIENADNYFNPDNAQRLQQLDLLLMTQGWREFIWTKIAQEGIRIKYMPEPGISISGNVKRGFSGKPFPDMNITLFAPQAKGDKLLYTKTDTAGKFYIDGLYLFGTQRIKIVSKDNQGKKGGAISMDSLYQNKLPVSNFAATDETPTISQQFESTATKRLTALNKIREEEIKELPGVTVTAKDSRATVTRDDLVSKFGYKDSVFSPTDADLKDYGDLENYLHHKLPGAMVDVDNGGLYFMGESNFGSGQVHVRPRFFVENREDIFDRLDYYQLPVNQISKIVIKHGISAITNQHVYQIYLTIKPDMVNSPDYVSTEITGYYEARNFYVPQPKAVAATGNYLTTLLWVPNIQTTTSGDTRISIDNRKMKANFRVVIEGLTENGVPVAGVLNYESR